jgi:opacity protein-like surface antigen
LDDFGFGWSEHVFQAGSFIKRKDLTIPCGVIPGSGEFREFFRMAFSEDWFGTLLLDAGGTGDTSTWQALATVGYRLNDNWALQGGYRYLQSEWDTDLGQSSLEFSGPILGVTYRF